MIGVPFLIEFERQELPCQYPFCLSYRHKTVYAFARVRQTLAIFLDDQTVYPLRSE